MKRILALAAALLATSALAQSQPAQPTPQFGEKVDVNLVMIDAVVTDSRGNQILGLGPDDFIVTEEGQPQKVDSVEYFTNRTLVNEPENKAAFKTEKMNNARYFILFFDKPEGTALWDQLVRARSAAQKFVKELKPGDRVAVAAHDVRLKVYSDFTNNPQQLVSALNDATTFGLGITNAPAAPPEDSIFRHIDTSRMMNRTGTVFEALQVLADAVRPIKARKDLVLFSAGILTPDQELRDGVALNESRYYRPALASLNAADVAVYPANIVAIPNTQPMFHQALESLAADTNGEYFRFNTSFSPALQKIEGETNGYYLISYYTKKPHGSMGYQHVKVQLRNPEFKVKSREGYAYGPS